MARKAKAEELGLLKKKAALLKRLPKLGKGTSELDVMRYLQVVSEGQLGGMLSQVEAGDLRTTASIALRALRQHHANKDVIELEEILERVEAFEKRQAKKGAAERDRTR